jgi:hypothetical protein
VLVVFAFLHRLDLVSSSVKCEFELPGFVCPFVLRKVFFRRENSENVVVCVYVVKSRYSYKQLPNKSLFY